ncbi:MAG: hypothetical protein IKG56_02745 [Clostridia bacterium]|nr:hypothetical protein [Clostridia bacterium]
MKNKRLSKKEKGITLVALVVTIIVLLILAGISIKMIFGNNNIINKTKDAAEIYANTEENDITRLKESKKEILELTGHKLSTEEELDALKNNGIKELTDKEIKNDYLKNNNRIKGVITGDVPLTEEMTYITGNKETGVVVSIDGSEFVWVPVDNINNMAMCKQHSGTSNCNLEFNSEKTELQCTNHNNSTDICGKLYALSISEGFNASLSNQTFGFNNAQVNAQNSHHFREPDLLNAQDTQVSIDELKAEFKKMCISVAKYKGFYVARYELGIENGNPVSKNADTNPNVTTTDATKNDTPEWYGLYQKEKEMFNSTDKNVQSSMMWGCQYDAMYIWMGDDANEQVGDRRNTSQITGKKSDDIIKNVYDLFGCNFETTLEADTMYDKNDRKYYYARISRGGNFEKDYKPTNRALSYTSNKFSGRPSIYIK